MLYKIRQSLQYGLAVISILGTLLIGDISADSYSMYAAAALVLGAWGELRRLLDKHPYEWMFYLLELSYVIWFSSKYGGILYLLFGAAFVALPVQWSKSERIAALGLSMIGVNIAVYGLDWGWVLSANMYMLTFGALIVYMYVTLEDKQHMEQMNDRLRKQTYELDAARMEGLRYAGKVELATQAEERNRIARELHDELGHKLIRLKLMMDAAAQVKDMDAKQAERLYESVRDQLSDSMEMLRRTVRRMKPAEADVRAYSLERLVEELDQQHQFPAIAYEVSGVPFALYPSMEVVLFHNAQEAITNAIRHGDATEIKLHLHYRTDEIELYVSNNGVCPPLPIERGIGIRGMQERTQALGGSVEWQLEPSFGIRTTIPLRVG